MSEVNITPRIEIFHSSIDEWVVEASFSDPKLNDAGELEAYTCESRAWDRVASGRELISPKRMKHADRIQISLVRLAKWRD